MRMYSQGQMGGKSGLSYSQEQLGGRTSSAQVHLNRSYCTFINQRPRPPSWRDFLPNSSQNKPSVSTPRNSQIDFTDINQIHHSNVSSGEFNEGLSSIRENSSPTPVNNVQFSSCAPSSSSTHFQSVGNVHSRLTEKHHKVKRKKIKAKIHRTRSHSSIDVSDLPDEVPLGNMTVSLANTKPKEFGLRKKNAFDGLVYLDDNSRKCQRWLADVKAASPPLEDVAFAQGSGVDVIVPEETWVERRVLSRNNRKQGGGSSSVSSSSGDGDSPSPVPHYQDSSQNAASYKSTQHGEIKQMYSDGILYPVLPKDESDLPLVDTDQTETIHLAKDHIHIMDKNVTGSVVGEKLSSHILPQNKHCLLSGRSFSDNLSPVEEVDITFEGESSIDIRQDRGKSDKSLTSSLCRL